MTPSIDRIDPIHVFVSDRDRAERWYQDGNPFEITSYDYAALEASLRREGR
jgi:hypothetical protein